MKRLYISLFIYVFLVTFVFTGCCRRSAEDLWDDTKSCGRHMSLGFRRLGGKHTDSRQVCRPDEFYRYVEPPESYDMLEYEPLPEDEWPKDMSISGVKTPQEQTPMSSPIGVRHTRIPGIESFEDPKKNGELASIFENLLFPYDSSLIKGENNLQAIQNIVNFLKKYPQTYIFIEGHCDERGPEAYNLALGTRRSNAVRNLLIKQGASPENLFAVSYGKERPLDLGHTEESWAKNRRAEFKIYRE